MHIERLTVGILQHVAVTAVQDALGTVRKRAGVVAGSGPASPRLDAGEGDRRRPR